MIRHKINVLSLIMWVSSIYFHNKTILKQRQYNINSPSIPILPLGSIRPQLQQFMEQIKVHGIQASQMKAGLSTHTKGFDHLGRETDKGINYFGGGLGANGSTEREHSVFVFGVECICSVILVCMWKQMCNIVKSK